MARQTPLLQGTLDLLILRALATGECHGLGVSRSIEKMTKGAFVVKPGSLFPGVHRLEEAGWQKSFWNASEKQPSCEVQEETAGWNRIALAMSRALEG